MNDSAPGEALDVVEHVEVNGNHRRIVLPPDTLQTRHQIESGVEA